eukprot:scaffold47368_cov36-Tisochrysis_lutea.AAC.3
MAACAQSQAVRAVRRAAVRRGGEADGAGAAYALHNSLRLECAQASMAAAAWLPSLMTGCMAGSPQTGGQPGA